MTKQIIVRARTDGSLMGFANREATRIIPYKYLTFAACPNRSAGGKIFNYDLIELTTGLKVVTLRTITECRQWLVDNWGSLVRVMNVPRNRERVREMITFVESADTLPTDIAYTPIFDKLFAEIPEFIPGCL